MAPPKDIARSYPKRGLTADVGFRSEPKFCGDGSTSLDGTSDYLESTLTTALGSGFSVSLWFLKRSTTGSNNYLMSSGSAGGGSFISLSCTASVNALAVYDQSLFLTSSLTADLNQWHHAVLTVGTGANSYTVYLDGIGESLANTASPNITNGDFELGRYSLGNTHYHDGLVSDVRIYDQVLTQDQVREIYNNPGLTIPTGLSASNLRHRYKLETDYVDTGASGDDLTAFGSPSFTVNRPQLPRGLDLARGAAMARVYTGRCVQFDGSADHLEAAVYSNSSDYYSVSVWIKPDAIGTNRNIVASGDTGDNAFLIFLLSTGKINFYGNDTGGDYAITHQTTLTAGRWYHLAMSVDQSDAANNTIKAYIDGVENTTSKTSSSWVGNPSALEIAARNSSTFFDGAIAGVKVFNSELTAAQVRELYHNPEQVLPTGVSASNLRRYYPLSDYNDTAGTGGRYFQDMGADGEPAVDQGSANMAFAQPVPCPQLGLQQSATRLHFPGATTQASATIPALGTAASLSCWFFWDDSSRTSYPIAVGTVNSTTDGLNIRIDTSGNVTTYENAAFDSGLNVTEGAWNHIVIVSQTASPYWKCFVNNVEATSPAAKSAAINITSTNAHVGTNAVNFGAAGIVADAAIWSSELSDPDVAALYNSGVMGADVSQVDSSNLIAWWKCDDLTSFKDYSGNGRSMTITTALNAASFPENASGSTIVGDFSMKRKGVSVLNFFSDPSTIDSSAVIPAQESVFPAYPGGYTFSAFFKLIKRGAFSTIFYSTDTSVANQLGVFGSSSGIFQIDAGDGGTVSTRVRVSAVTAITDSDWHHFAVTITHGTPTTTKVYIDGALDVTDTSFTQTGAPTPSDIVIGDYPSGTNEARGPIACFRTYQVPLSDNEIEQIYRSDLRLIKGLANE